MRKLLFLTVVSCLALTLIIGCSSDDDNAVNSNDKEEGTLQDEDFLMAQEAIFSADDYSDELFVWMDILVDTVFEDSASLSAGKQLTPAATLDEYLVTYHETSDYWYLYFSHIDTIFDQQQAVQDIITYVLEDSVQFLHGGDAVQWPDSLQLTGVNNGAILTLNLSSGVGNVSATQNVSLVGLPGAIAGGGYATLNGTRTFDLDISNEGGSCSITLDGDATATNILMNMTETEAGGCPESGTLRHVGTIAIECTGDTTISFSDTWVFNQTFYGDSTVIVAENSTTRWTFTEMCHSGGITKLYADVLARIRER